ncbi:hypothetical protein HYW46_03105 [Candidatus Daviesbacteria bacterium]|nr:hypothetical protein [Candidatus Daviesbacteria bacterium]
MIILRAKPGETTAGLISRFQKRCIDQHRIQELKNKMYFRSNTERNQERQKRKDWLILKLNEQI